MAGEDRRAAAERSLIADKIRPVPCSLEMEQSVLGGLMYHPQTWSKVADVLTPQCFHEAVHRAIFEVIKTLREQDKPATPITCKQYLGDLRYSTLTMPEYLARLYGEAGPASEMRGYALILNDLAVRRQAINVMTDCLERAYNAAADDSGKAIVDTATDALGALRTAPEEVRDYEPFAGPSYRALMQAQAAFQRDGALSGMSTGLPELDAALGGLADTDLIILGGRPGMGKSALCGNIAWSVAEYLHQAGERGVVAINSLEMSSEQFALRLVGAKAEVPGWKVRRRRGMQEEDVRRFNDAYRKYEKLPLETDESGALTLAQLRTRARNLHKRKRIRLLIIDYLQMMVGTGSRDKSRAQDLTEITTGLKALAKELKCPVIALSQLNRALENRDDKRPQLSDLRESGSIEQDADIVMFVHREEYYLKRREPRQGTAAHEDWQRQMTAARGAAEIIVGKNRHGPDGTVRVGFNAELTLFTNEVEVQDDLVPIPERPKKETLRLSAKATQAYGILQTLTIHEAAKNDGSLGIPSFIKKPVSWERWKDRCLRDLLDPGRTDSVVSSFMEQAFLELKNKSMVMRQGDYVWITDPEGR